MQINYYEMLGCTRNSTHEEIKRAYHQRLLQFHPDKNSAIDNCEFHDIREAWRILGHPQSRKKYDAACKQEELEEENSMYEHILSSDLEESASDNRLFYRCRCGDYYFVEKDDLEGEESLMQVMCNGCTLSIIVETRN